MPYIRVQTNVAVADAETLLKKLSAAVADTTGKPEAYVQAVVQGGVAMYMAGSDAPTAHVEVKAIGFPTAKAKPLSAAVCAVLGESLSLDGKRIFISFNSYEGAMWGADGGTF